MDVAISKYSLLCAEMFALKKGRAERQDRFGRQTGDGMGSSVSALPVVVGGDGNVLSLET